MHRGSLLTSIRNLYIDQQRKHKIALKFTHGFSQNETSIVPNISVEPYLEKILAALSSRDREILLLSIVEEYTAQEIADVLQMPRGTVLSILSRTKLKLKKQLEERNDLAI